MTSPGCPIRFLTIDRLLKQEPIMETKSQSVVEWARSQGIEFLGTTLYQTPTTGCGIKTTTAIKNTGDAEDLVLIRVPKHLIVYTHTVEEHASNDPDFKTIWEAVNHDEAVNVCCCQSCLSFLSPCHVTPLWKSTVTHRLYD